MKDHNETINEFITTSTLPNDSSIFIIINCTDVILKDFNVKYNMNVNLSFQTPRTTMNNTTVDFSLENWQLSWKKIIWIILFCLLIAVTIIGNTLVIASVMTTRRLRTVTNCFVMSLAVADWLVGIFVLPPAVFVFIVGSWPLGWILCDIWISLDVLLCTASILSLCAISIDRYLAVTQPLNYSKRRRSKRLAMLMILIVWILALAITCPPFLGWYDQERRNSDMTDCRYNQNKGYVVFSAMGSFFIPCCVMLYVYSKICCVLTSRQSRLTRTEACERSVDLDNEYITSEFDTSYHNYSVSKDMTSTVNGSSSQPPPQTTLYELLEYAKSRSILKNSQHNNSNNSAYIIRSMNSVQFNQLTSSDNLSATSAKSNRIASKIPIRISSLKRETKTAQTLSMVVGGFIACWLPFFIVYLLIPFLDKNAISDNWQEFLTWLGWMNSAVNPFIYAFYNVDFRIAFWRLTFRNCCHNHHNVVL